MYYNHILLHKQQNKHSTEFACNCITYMMDVKLRNVETVNPLIADTVPYKWE